MAYHRQLRIKENGKSIIKPTKEESIERKIKHLQRYQKKLIECSYAELPQIVMKLIAYVIKKELLRNPIYIKEMINAFIVGTINAYKNDYDIKASRTIKEMVLLDNFIKHPKLKNPCNEIDKTIRNNTIDEIMVLSKNHLKKYKSWDYKSK